MLEKSIRPPSASSWHTVAAQKKQIGLSMPDNTDSAETPKVADQPISDILLNQRYRNHLIGYFEWVSSHEEQRKYQAAVPYVHMPHEAFNQWEDYASDRILRYYVEPVFSVEEQQALRDYRAVLNSASEDTPQILPPLEQMIGTEPWERLRAAAEKALEIFMRRGSFDWEVEQFPTN
ncbi:hypothetical protein FJV76_30915 [Mesorhizobium sp. WSM4303]|uniref:hypothetical protein n=1 Tax=unclassified Mesorhizobium TaxID=325217 RepID=UPI00115F51CC|nr:MULTISPECIES: hypothetical protein [unclassified Mesorhizobium]TRC85060.1 hypothetical protein FJV77_31815 [Mesorhizobium sp. WSM4306]TRC94143.1 hypothetical protein FJV76_30915 [Mesorhizobium sp. WSM4303]